MELVEIWEPERRYVWMKRWLETHRRRKAAGQALARLIAARLRPGLPPRRRHRLRPPLSPLRHPHPDSRVSPAPLKSD